ncbi:hypothetical protein GMDG_06343 [Pseudogymnoascus destructans 20631-21]|uniref:Thioester reductase (TE) domain-containing protein n=1 Tax=Pseudogymnoascus destructans (strain ATCC MYA-4855 / 20631-21) TaxID=658429 RepID=L8FT19_PSED2|nr:hypothetical protein GMDG_06343 [Pseudogymnoascus destructans 20631-21]
MPHSIQKVFLTGANGFVACHILSDLIKAGYLVTATVRSKTKSQQMLDAHPEWKDIKEIIDPAVQGTTSLLKSVHEYGGQQVKRVVLLSSSAAIVNPMEDTSITETHIARKIGSRQVTAEMAVEQQNPLFGYCAAKTLAEKAAWKFIEDNKTSFDLTVINPDVIIGPMLHNVSTPEKINETNMVTIYNFLDGTTTGVGEWGLPFYHFVWLRLFLIGISWNQALTDGRLMCETSPEHMFCLWTAPQHQRVGLVLAVITPQLVVNIIRKNFPELKSRVPEGNPSQIVPDGINLSRWNNEKSYQVLEKDWTLETSVVDTVNDILKREKEWQK